MSDQGDQPKKQKLKGYEKHRAKYGDQVDQFVLTDASAIKGCQATDVDDRQWTDLFFGVCFAIFLIAFIVVSSIGIHKNQFSTKGITFTAPKANGGNCTGDFSHFYINDDSLTNVQDALNSGYCVKSCPAKGKALDCATGVTSCPASAPYASEPFKLQNNLCFPTDTTVLTKGIFAKVQAQVSPQFIKYSPILIGIFFLTILLNIMYIKLMSAYPEALSKFSVVLVLVFWLIVAVVSFYTAFQEPSFKAGGIIIGLACLLMLGLFVCWIWCYYSQFEIAIAVIDTAADYYNDTKRLFLLSCWVFNIQFWFTILFIAGLFGIAYMGTLDGQQQLFNSSISDTNGYIALHYSNKYSGAQSGMTLFLIISWMWMMIYFTDCLGFIAMYGAATYYFSSEGDLSVGSAQVWDGYKLSMTKHTGSIAYGSAIQTLIRVMIMLADAAESDDGNAAVQIIGCCIKCCLLCIEGAIEMLTRQAYANIAISGDKFCKSAWNGFMITLRHLIRFYLATTVAGFLVFIGKIFIMLLTVLISTLIFHSIEELTTSNKIILVVISWILSVMVNSIFLGLFDEAILCTLQCVAVDMDFNGGHPKYGSASFQTNMQIILDKDDSKYNQGNQYQAAPAGNQVV